MRIISITKPKYPLHICSTCIKFINHKTQRHRTLTAYTETTYRQKAHKPRPQRHRQHVVHRVNIFPKPVDHASGGVRVEEGHWKAEHVPQQVVVQVLRRVQRAKGHNYGLGQDTEGCRTDMSVVSMIYEFYAKPSPRAFSAIQRGGRSGGTVR